MDKETLTSSAMHAPGAVLLISCYELGHRPMGLTRPLSALEAAGFSPDAIDIAVEPLDAEKSQTCAIHRYLCPDAYCLTAWCSPSPTNSRN